MAKPRPFEPDPGYQRDRAFVLTVAEFLDSLPQSPTTTIGEGRADGTVAYREVPTPKLAIARALADGLAAAERQGARVARDALRLGLQDLLEASRYLEPSRIPELNARLQAADLLSLGAMRARVWKTIPKVLARGRIRTEAEYYLLIERLNDVSDPELSGDDRGRLSSIIEDYEQRHAKPNPPAA